MLSSQRRAFCWFLFFAAFLPLAGTPAQDGGIELFSGNTIFESGSRISLSHIYVSRGSLFQGTEEVPNPLERSMWEHRMVLGFDHGVTPKLALSFLLPVVEKESESLGPSGNSQVSGLADAALLAKYRFFSEYWSQSAFHASVIAGLELPTGSSEERDADGFLPFSMQLGTGSVDGIVGLGLTLSPGRYRLDLHAIYKANNEGARDFSEGDYFSVGLDFAYRFYHAKYPGPSASAKISLHWRHEDPDELGGVNLGNTGLRELRIRGGLVYHPYPEIDLVALVEIPLYGSFKSANGEGQLALDVRTFFGFGFRF